MDQGQAGEEESSLKSVIFKYNERQKAYMIKLWHIQFKLFILVSYSLKKKVFCPNKSFEREVWAFGSRLDLLINQPSGVSGQTGACDSSAT